MLFVTYCVFQQILVALAVNIAQIYVLFQVRKNAKVKIDRDEYLESRSSDLKDPKNGPISVGSASDFFTKEVIKTLGTLRSNADKTFVDGIVAKYEKETGP